MLTKKEPAVKEPAVKSESKPSKSPTCTPASNTSHSQGSQCSVSCNSHKPEQFTPAQGSHEKTRITVNYDVGFNNQLTIRGKGGANLSWDKGIPLKNIKRDEWIFETDAHFSQFEFKILVNDNAYEQGQNHVASWGSNCTFTPHF